MITLHVRKTDGEIVGWESGTSPRPVDGLVMVPIEVADNHHVVPDQLLHRYDFETGDIVDKTAAEQAFARLPTDMDVRMAIAGALSESDAWMVPDRPMTDERRNAWKAYRQALRDLSKQPTVTAMIKSWPVRPDGVDPIPLLRARITGI